MQTIHLHVELADAAIAGEAKPGSSAPHRLQSRANLGELPIELRPFAKGAATCEFELSDPLRTRLGEFQDHPEFLDDTGRLLFPNPDHVDKSPRGCWPGDVGAWLWERAIPEALRSVLERIVKHDSVRVVLHTAVAEAAMLPWEMLLVPVPKAQPQKDKQQQDEHTPFLNGHWHLLRLQPVDATVAAPPADHKGEDLQRRVLLLVGSLIQGPRANSALHAVVQLAKSIRAAGFRCDIAAACERLHDFEMDVEATWHDLTKESVLELLANSDHDIVHYIGHSTATKNHRIDGPAGADQLRFEIADTGQEFKVAIDEFAAALRKSRAQLMVFEACKSREAMAQTLLRHGAVTMVVGMGANVAPAACADFGGAFYHALAKDGATCTMAVHEGRQALRRNYLHLLWLPLVHTSDATTALGIAGPESTLIDQYCSHVLTRHRAFEGIFAGDKLHGDALDRVAIAMSVQRLAAELGTLAGAELPVLARRAGEEMPFDELLSLYRAWILGGDPGIGKSTMLRLHLRFLARQRRRRVCELPVYLPLAAWAAEFRRSDSMRGIRENPTLDGLLGSVAHYLQQHYGLPGLAELIERKGRAGELVLLLDGFDELSGLPHPDRPHDAADMDWFVKKPLSWIGDPTNWGKCKRVIATRRYSTSEQLSPWGRNADVCPLDVERAVTLLQQILASREKTRSRAVALAQPWRERFGANGPGSRLWREVSAVPLLVSLLALQVETDPGLVTKLGFFEGAFAALLHGRHREDGARQKSPAEQMAANERAAAVGKILRYLAWRFTVDRRRSATLADLLGYLQTQKQAPDRQPTDDVLAAVAKGVDWIDAKSCLEHIAKTTLILGPLTTDEAGQWQFAHKSFQEALCARYLHERYVVVPGTEGEDVDGLIAAFDSWVFRVAPAAAEAAQEPEWVPDTEREKQILKELTEDWNRVDATQGLRRVEIWQEAWRVTWLRAEERNKQLNTAGNTRDPDSIRDAALPMVARERAIQESQESFLESLAMLAGVLENPEPLLEALLQRGWQIGYRIARSLPWMTPGMVGRVLARLPEVLQWAEIVFSLPQTTKPQHQMAMVVELERLASASGKGHPSRVFLFDEALRLFAEITKDPQVAQRASEAREAILGMFDKPAADALRPVLTGVPGREQEADPATGRPGVLLWREIPAGDFRMGTPGGGPSGDEGPVQRQIDEPFWMMAVPVVVALYRLFCPSAEMFRKGEWQASKDLDPALPAVSVTWFAAQMFVRWLNQHGRGIVETHLRQRSGLAAGETIEFRLPTEEQWEYAARAGTQTRYFFGEDEAGTELGEWAWFGDPKGALQKVGSKNTRNRWHIAGANAWGLLDVHGNVWEWCQDIYRAKLPGGPERLVFASGAPRVTRGGSFRSVADVCRSAGRDGSDPDDGLGDQGFRLVCVRVRPQLG